MSMVSCPKGPYPTCLRMADRALFAGYPRIMVIHLHRGDQVGIFMVFMVRFKVTMGFMRNITPDEYDILQTYTG